MQIAAFALFFPVFWLGIIWLVSRLGGWHRLARTFVTDRPPAGETIGWTSGKFSFFSSYNHCLNVTVSASGVRIEPNILFKFGHSPLFFPWAAVAGLTRRRLLLGYVSALHIQTDNGLHAVTLFGQRLSDALAKYAPAHLTAPPSDNRDV